MPAARDSRPGSRSASPGTARPPPDAGRPRSSFHRQDLLQRLLVPQRHRQPRRLHPRRVERVNPPVRRGLLAGHQPLQRFDVAVGPPQLQRLHPRPVRLGAVGRAQAAGRLGHAAGCRARPPASSSRCKAAVAVSAEAPVLTQPCSWAVSASAGRSSQAPRWNRTRSAEICRIPHEAAAADPFRDLPDPPRFLGGFLEPQAHDQYISARCASSHSFRSSSSRCPSSAARPRPT